MGSCQTRQNYLEGNLTLDNRLLPHQRIERNQVYPYFQFKSDLIFEKQQILKSKLLKIEISEPMYSNLLNVEQQGISKEQESNIKSKSRRGSLQQTHSFCNTSSSQCSESERKSNLKQAYLGTTSPKTPIILSKFGQKNKVRFAKGTAKKSCSQRSISQQDHKKKHRRKY